MDDGRYLPSGLYNPDMPAQTARLIGEIDAGALAMFREGIRDANGGALPHYAVAPGPEDTVACRMAYAAGYGLSTRRMRDMLRDAAKGGEDGPVAR